MSHSRRNHRYAVERSRSVDRGRRLRALRLRVYPRLIAGRHLHAWKTWRDPTEKSICHRHRWKTLGTLTLGVTARWNFAPWGISWGIKRSKVPDRTLLCEIGYPVGKLSSSSKIFAFFSPYLPYSFNETMKVTKLYVERWIHKWSMKKDFKLEKKNKRKKEEKEGERKEEKSYWHYCFWKKQFIFRRTTSCCF